MTTLVVQMVTMSLWRFNVEILMERAVAFGGLLSGVRKEMSAGLSPRTEVGFHTSDDVAHRKRLMKPGNALSKR